MHPVQICITQCDLTKHFSAQPGTVWVAVSGEGMLLAYAVPNCTLFQQAVNLQRSLTWFVQGHVMFTYKASVISHLYSALV